MPRQTIQEAVAEARQAFQEIGAEADSLAVPEEQNDLPGGLRLRERSRKWQRAAEETSAKLNSAAPRLRGEKMELLRSTSLMLSEIIHANTPEVVAERFHARRDQIDANMVKLATG